MAKFKDMKDVPEEGGTIAQFQKAHLKSLVDDRYRRPYAYSAKWCLEDLRGKTHRECSHILQILDNRIH